MEEMGCWPASIPIQYISIKPCALHCFPWVLLRHADRDIFKSISFNEFHTAPTQAAARVCECEASPDHAYKVKGRCNCAQHTHHTCIYQLTRHAFLLVCIVFSGRIRCYFVPYLHQINIHHLTYFSYITPTCISL